MRMTSENTHLNRLLADREWMGFLVFSLDLGAMRHPGEFAPGGLVYPQFKGEDVPLWDVTVSETEARATQNREQRETEAEAHQKRVDLYAERVADGRNPLTGEEWDPHAGGDEWDEFETPEIEGEVNEDDEWTNFWGGESPTEKMAHWVGEE